MSATPRSVPRGRWAWAAMLVGALACRAGATLDGETETETQGAADSTAAAADTSTGEPSTGEPPVSLCPPGCTSVLRSDWVHQGEPGDRTVAEIVQGLDGSLVVGVRRGAGGFRLVRLSAEGELQWSLAPQLPCVACELVDIALLPSGAVLLSATAVPEVNPTPAAILARLEVESGGLAWTRSFTLDPGPNMSPRAGEIAVLQEDRIVQLRVSGSPDGEIVHMHEVDDAGNTRFQRQLGIQSGTGSAWPVLAAAGPYGDLVIAYPWWGQPEDLTVLVARTARLLPPDYHEISAAALPVALDDLAIDGDGRRLELARSTGSDTITLLLTSLQASDPELWSVSLPLVSTSSTRAALAIGPDDDVYVAARTTPRSISTGFFVVELALARWSPLGELRWQGALPLDMMATDDPIDIVVDGDGGVIVGTVVQGRLHVARYELACACE